MAWEFILRNLEYLLVVIAYGTTVQQNLTNKIYKMIYRIKRGMAMHQMFICPLLAQCVFSAVLQSVQTFVVKD